jgi:hypothetical protein
MTNRTGKAVAIAVWVALGAGIGLASAASLNLVAHNLTPYRTCTVTATPTTTTSVIDAGVRQANATSNFGTVNTLDIASGNGANRRTYLRFDLTACVPAVPAAAIVRLATLRLYLTAVPAVCRTIDIFPVTSSWTETGITWNNEPLGASINNPPTASRTGSFDVGTPVGCQNRTTGAYVVGGTVTSDVASFVSGSASNFGWMLRDDVEGSATTRTVTVSSKQLGTIPQEPQLVVTYVAVP